jgi:hypothetical protein
MFGLCTLAEKQDAYRDGYAEGVKDSYVEVSLKDVPHCTVCHEPWRKKDKRKIKMTGFVHVDELESSVVKSEYKENPNSLPLATDVDSCGLL